MAKWVNIFLVLVILAGFSYGCASVSKDMSVAFNVPYPGPGYTPCGITLVFRYAQ